MNTSTRALQIVLTVLLCVSNAQAAPSHDIAASREDRWYADIDYLARELPRVHPDPFQRLSRESFLVQLRAIRDGVPALHDLDIPVRLQQVIAQIGDAHTTLEWGESGEGYFPFRLQWFADGVYVTRTLPEYSAACGSRLESIDEHPFEAVYEAVGNVISHENDQWPKYLAMRTLVSVRALRSLGVISESQVSRFRFRTARGAAVDLAVMPIDAANAVGIVFAPEASREDQPLYRMQGDRNYWFMWRPEEGLLYVKYNKAANDPVESFAAFAQGLLAIADAEPVRRFVIDLRDNTGGNSGIMKPLRDGIRARPHLNARDTLFVIIGPATFSSALLNAIDLQQTTAATLVGEPTGGKPNAYGEVRSFGLPFSGLIVSHSTKYFHTVEGDPSSLEPDRFVPIDSAFYFADRDPVIEEIIGHGSPVPTPSGTGRRRRALGRLLPRVCH